MPLTPQHRWFPLRPPVHEAERKALESLRRNLPDRDPWTVYTNVEFFDLDGRINEVDALVLTPHCLMIVEVKCRPGRVTGDTVTWTYRHADSKQTSIDNPLNLAERKAKRLSTLLEREMGRNRRPYVGSMVYLAGDPPNEIQLPLNLRVYGAPKSPQEMGIIKALMDPPPQGQSRIDASAAQQIRNALSKIGIRPSARSIGSFRLDRLIEDNLREAWQDHSATHIHVATTKARVRLYPFAHGITEADRQRQRRLVEREFETLVDLRHPGILSPREFVESDLGPALIFPALPGAERLDLWLAARGAGGLPPAEALMLLTGIADALRLAHGSGITHRSLTPDAVLVHPVAGSAVPEPVISGWQTLTRARGVTTTAPTRFAEGLQDSDRVWLAPETDAMRGDWKRLDVFSLGTLAWLLLTGTPPADGAAGLSQRLQQEDGLRLPAEREDIPRSLYDLVQNCTRRRVQDRLASAADVYRALAAIRLEPPAAAAEAEPDPNPEPVQVFADPLSAGPGDLLAPEMEVVRVLGRGATARVLLVRIPDPDDPEGTLDRVLKIALEARGEERLLAEGRALRRLRHDRIVECHRAELRLGERLCLLLDFAGDRTLAERLASDGTPDLTLLQRWGEDLLDALVYLEEMNVPHRDLKPDNLGVEARSSDKGLRLKLFDFSLAAESLESIEVGTRAYADPFLKQRPFRRWDWAAEQFSAAMVLHEMATGTLPVWGDGESDPASLDGVEVSASERLPQPIRDEAYSFFATALRRDPLRRFAGFRAMRDGWREVFARLQQPQIPPDLAAIARLTAHSPLEGIGLPPEAVDVLRRRGITRVGQFLAEPRRSYRYMRGVADALRKQIREKAKELAERRPDLVPPGSPNASGERLQDTNLDGLLEEMLEKATQDLDEESREYRALRALIDPDDGSDPWRSPADIARAHGVRADVLRDRLQRARQAWTQGSRHSGAALYWVGQARDFVEAEMKSAGGALTLEEAESVLLTRIGSLEDDAAIRRRLACNVLHALTLWIEAESPPRWIRDGEGSCNGLLIADQAVADHLAEAAALLRPALAEQPILDQAAALERLKPLDLPRGWRLDGKRRLELTVASLPDAAISPLQMVYRLDLPPERALEACGSLLLAMKEMNAAGIRKFVRDNFPVPGEAVPDSPGALQVMLRERGIPLTLNLETGLFSTPTGGRTVTQTVDARQGTPPLIFTRRLQQLQRNGGFLVVMMRTSEFLDARAGVAQMGFRLVDAEKALLTAVRRRAEQLGVSWANVQAADSPLAPDWPLLQRLVAETPFSFGPLVAGGQPVAILHAGLLVRWSKMPVLWELRQRAGADWAPSLLLVPAEDPSQPLIEGQAIGAIDAGEWCTLPRRWRGPEAAAA